MKRSRWIMSLAAGVATVLALAGCASSGGSGASADSSPVKGGNINVAWFSQPASLDPIATTAYVTRDIDNNVFETLITYDADYRIRPVLAKSYKASADYKKFTFVLRKGVKFQNGEPMTSADVVASIQRWIADSSSGKSFFSDASVSAPDSDTVVVALPNPLYSALSLMAQVATQPMIIVPKTSIEAKGSTGIPLDKLIGTGPYKISEWKQDSYIKLKKFSGYTQPAGKASGLAGEKAAYADTLTYNIVPDITTRQNGLSTGEYDYASELSSDNYQQIHGDNNLKTELVKSNFIGLVFNKKSGPMADVKVRRAVQAALDMDSILRASWTGNQYNASGALTPANDKQWYTKAGLQNYNTKDIKEAKSLLASSSYDGASVKLLTTRDYPYMYNSAVVVKQELEQIGINVDLVVTDWATVLANRADPAKMDMFITTFSYATPVSYNFLGNSWPGWTDDPAIRSALDGINASTSDAQAKAANEKLQKAVYDYVPLTIFGSFSSFSAWNKKVGGARSLVGPILYGAYKTK